MAATIGYPMPPDPWTPPNPPPSPVPPQPLPESNPWPSVVLQLGLVFFNMVGTWAFVYFQGRETREKVEHVQKVAEKAEDNSAATRSIIVGD